MDRHLSHSERRLLRLAINNRKRLRVKAAVGPGKEKVPGLPTYAVDFDDLCYVLCALCEWRRGPFDNYGEAADLLCTHLEGVHR